LISRELYFMISSSRKVVGSYKGRRKHDTRTSK
jgi:hypothetical protein